MCYIPLWSFGKSKKPELVSWDFDGTFSTGKFEHRTGDVFVTGRCYDEAKYVVGKLKQLGVTNPIIHFNPLPLAVRGEYSEECRIKSAWHKINTLNMLSIKHKVRHFEDDPIQIALIKKHCRDVTIVVVDNEDHDFYGEQYVQEK